jgi:hypothetical protein
MSMAGRLIRAGTVFLITLALLFWVPVVVGIFWNWLIGVAIAVIAALLVATRQYWREVHVDDSILTGSPPVDIYDPSRYPGPTP